MRIGRIMLFYLLAGHAGPSAAATATANLRVSATVASACAAGSGQAFPIAYGLARVRCMPAADYAVSFKQERVDLSSIPGVQARASNMLLVPDARRQDVLVVEIRY